MHPIEPVFPNPPIDNAVEGNGRDGNTLAGRGKAGKLALMSAADGEASDDFVAFRNLVFGRVLEIGKRAAQVGHKHLEPLPPGAGLWLTKSTAMISFATCRSP
jgi:hypothetical protein